MSVLEASGIQLQFGNRTVLSDVYLKLETGKITGLAGINGSGKTSLMKIIFGTLQPQSKSIHIDGRHVSKAYLRKGMVNYMPQHLFLPGWVKVGTLLQYYRLDASTFTEETGLPGIDCRLTRLPHSERRLLELYITVKARTLFSLLDEPFASLSPFQLELAVGLIQQQKYGKGILLSDHNWDLLNELTKDCYSIVRGNICKKY